MKFLVCFYLVLLSMQTFAGNGRALLVVIDLAEKAQHHKGLYRAETKKAVKRIEMITKGHYDRLIIHHGTEATKEYFLSSMAELLNDPEILSVDSIVYLHGKNPQYINGPSVCFVDEGPCTSVYEISKAVNNLPLANEKLRMLYSDACWGQYHVDAWLNAGFKVANGSLGVDANHSLDLKRFLKKWVAGESYEKAMNFANAAAFTKVSDLFVKNANSFKVVKGNSSIRISDDRH